MARAAPEGGAGVKGRSGAGEPLVRVRSLRKAYGDRPVLRGVDLDVAHGERVAVIGPSGSGKSTLLRLLMTLEKPDGGTIEIDGDPMWTARRGGREVPADEAHLRAVRGRIGMVFQQFNLFPHRNVLRNVTLAPQLRLGLTRREAEDRARRLLALVGLAERAEQYPATLSGGQKQRVAIARALAMQPRLMLFDEVTSALDPQLVGEVLAVLRRLADDTDMTKIIVTHEMTFARDIADRVLFLDEGRIVEAGPPDRIFKDPEHPRTREFLQTFLTQPRGRRGAG